MLLSKIFFSIVLLNLCFGDDMYSVSNIFNSNFTGIIAAYGDFNADKKIDIFSISNAGRNFDVWLANENGGFELKPLSTSSGKDKVDLYISGLMVTDFNKDGYLDILSIWLPTNGGIETHLTVYWGLKNGIGNPLDLSGTFAGEPVLLDYNADLKADILTTDFITKATTVWISQNNSFIPSFFPSNLTIAHPHSCAYLQIIGSLNTDLVVTAENKKFQVFKDGDYSMVAKEYQIETNKRIGQSSFADFDEDVAVEHLLPVGNEIRIYSNGEWRLLANLEPNYTFDYDHTIDTKHLLPPTLIMGDYDNDGFPDVLTVVKDRAGRYTAILLKNEACDVRSNCVGFGRVLRVQKQVLPTIPPQLTIQSASFFDYLEDGNLDILLVTQTQDKKLQPLLLKNNIASDTCFMKVTVTSGLHSWPLGDLKPYGTNTIGCTVVYETTKFAGENQVSIASQLTQQAHFSLQQPYMLFGLGQTPNFVDTVNITLPQQNNKMSRSKVWTQIIPNSQLLVNPYDLDSPSTWTMRLFMIPSKQIFTTTAVLGATCIVLAFVVAGLFAVEKREDKVVRSQESQRFHFDAM